MALKVTLPLCKQF